VDDRQIAALQELSRRGKLNARRQGALDEILRRRSATAEAAPSGPTALETAADVGKSLGRGFFKGSAAIAGAQGDVAQFARKGAEYFGYPNVGKAAEAAIGRGHATTQGIIGTVERDITGPLDKPKTMPGRAAEKVGEFLPSVAVGPEGLLPKAVSAVTGGLGAFAGREATGSAVGEFFGGLLGGITPKSLAKLITPNFIDAQRQAANAYLASEGITAVTAGQKIGSKSLKYAESHLGDAPGAGGQASAATEQAGRQYTAAVLRRAGINSDRATADVIDKAFTDIGANMDALAARNTANMDPTFIREMDQALVDYETHVQKGAQRSAPKQFVDDFFDRLVKTSSLTGEQYSAFRSEWARRQRAAANDPEYSQFLGEAIDALDGMMLRSMTNPADMQAFEEARRQYRNLITIGNASIGAGEAANLGIITPAKLRQSLTNSERRKRDYMRGRGDFYELSNAGEIALTPLPQSGTAPRALASSLSAGLGAAIGGLLGGPVPGVVGAQAGAIAGPAAAGRTIMSGPVQGYLANQVAPGASQRFPGVGASALRAGAGLMADSPLQ
jgi:hypothetical protein